MDWKEPFGQQNMKFPIENIIFAYIIFIAICQPYIKKFVEWPTDFATEKFI